MQTDELKLFALHAIISCTLALLIQGLAGVIWGIQIGGTIAYAVFLFRTMPRSRRQDTKQAAEEFIRHWFHPKPKRFLLASAVLIPTLAGAFLFQLIRTVPHAEIYTVLISCVIQYLLTRELKKLS